MEKITDIGNYRKTVFNNSDFFKDYYYHSIIDLNLVKLDSILKNGILSKRLIEAHKLPAIYTHPADSIDSKNGRTYVSLSEFNTENGLNEVFDSFALHTLTSVSALVNKNVRVHESGVRITYFSDEVFCLDKVSKANIVGIIYPEHLSNLHIREICCLPRDMSCYTEDYINKWICYMENYFEDKMNVTNIMNSFAILKSIIDQYSYVASGNLVVSEQKRTYGIDFIDTLALELQMCWSRKFHIQNPTFADIVDLINDDRLPVYEIGQKTLKKVN